MHGNPLLKWLLAPLVVLVAVVGVRLAGGSREKAPPEAAIQLTPEEMKALGIEGDTPRDTVATLVGQVKQLRGELKGALESHQQQKAENERLRAREGNIDQRIKSALEGEQRRLQEEREQLAQERRETRDRLQDLQKRLEGISGQDRQAELPVGLGLEDGDGKDFTRAQGKNTQDGARWIEPDDAKPPMRSGASGSAGPPGFPTSFAPAQKSLSGVTASLGDAGNPIAAALTKPVYTVPSNATLMGSVSMTALIGRIPIDGTVNDPYPFKVLVGPDNLTANGIELPDVAGAVMSGTASGDWTLSCVRGQIRSVTFVFHDGAIRTLPEDGQNRGGGGRSATEGGLGWISDPHGIPCVSGERHSNARQYLGSQALITAAGAAAASLIESENGSVAVVSSSDGSLGTVGISGNEAMGRILAGGVRDMADWVNKLYGQAFAAVVVPPGARVAVHLEQPLHIDYDEQGRRVHHALGDTHVLDID